MAVAALATRRGVTGVAPGRGFSIVISSGFLFLVVTIRHSKMPPEQIARRRFLWSSAVTTGMLAASSAGCTEFVNDDGSRDASPGGDREHPGYTGFIPDSSLFQRQESAAQRMYTFIVFDAITALDEVDLEADFTGEEAINGSNMADTTFAAVPTVGLLVYVVGLFGLIGYSFTDALLPEFAENGGSTTPSDDGNTADLETRVSLITPFGYIYLGSYDLDVLAETAEGFTKIDTRGDYDIFAGGASEDDGFGVSLTEGLSFAACSNAVLIPLRAISSDGDGAGDDDNASNRESRRAMIDTMIDVVDGTEPQAVETDTDVDWMVRSAGHGAFGMGTFREAGQESLLTSSEDSEVTDDLPEAEETSEADMDTEDELLDDEMATAVEALESLLEEAVVYGSSIEPQTDSTVVAHVAIAYETSEAVPSDQAFEEQFGDTEGDFSMISHDTRVYLSSTYTV